MMNDSSGKSQSADTELQRSEEELAIAKARLDLAMSLSGVASWAWDMVSNEVIADDTLKKLFGFSPSESPATEQFLDRIDGRDRDRVAQAMERTLAGGGPFDEAYRIVRPDGETRYVQARGDVRRSADGIIEDFLGMISDITSRMVRELDLADRELQLRRVLDNSLAFLLVITADGSIVDVGQPVCEFVGMTRDQMIGDMLCELPWMNYSRESVATTKSMVEQAATGETVRRDIQVRRLDGSFGVIDFMISPIKDADGQIRFLIPTGVDVYDRKLAEDQARTSNAKLRVLFDQSYFYTGILDLDGNLTDINDAALVPFGFERKKVIGVPFWDTPWWYGQPESQAKLRENFARAVAGESYREELPYTGRNNATCISDFVFTPAVDDDDRVVFIVANGSDVTERYRYQQTIRLNEERIRLATAAAGMATFHIDPVTQKFYWSEELRRLIGRSERQQVDSPGEKMPDWIHPNDQAAVRDLIQVVLRDLNNADHSLDHRIVLGDGEVRYVRLQIRAIYETTSAADKESKHVSLIVGTLLDVTRQRQIEQQLRYERRLAQAASQAKSTFVANMSHEIRTPMTAILGYAELIRDRIDDSEACAHLQTIRRNGGYLLDIINDILDLSKIEAGKLDVELERFQPARVLEDVKSIMDVRAKHAGLSLQVHFDGKLPKVIQSDAKRLKQILINLIGNAIKFTKKGDVTIRVRHSAKGDQLPDGDLLATSVANTVARGMLYFDIIDTGIGMSQQQQERLFKPFSQGNATVTRQFGGTGLGLAISKRLAEMLGGQISVTSAEGVGSTFTASICTGDLDEIQMVNYADPESRVHKGNLQPLPRLACRVLVVDDRYDIRFLSKRLLTDAGATVDECEDGQFAVDHVAATLGTDKCPDLILLDMQMPNLDGYETARVVRNLGYTRPIIALTADAMQGDMNECLAAGCNDYLSKPIDAYRLVEMVAKMTSGKA